VDGLVGEGSGSGDDADAAALVDVSGHDSDLTLKQRTFSFKHGWKIHLAIKTFFVSTVTIVLFHKTLRIQT
jgi:hypothetical protein